MFSILKILTLILVTVLGWTGLELVQNYNIEKIHARDPSLSLNVDGNRVLWALENGQSYDPQVLKDIETWTSRRFDASDFRLQSLARILYKHRDAISQEEYELIKRVFLNFKYWMDQPGVDGMCFWSENHQLMFAASEFLAGQYWPKEIFSNADITGREHQAMARERILTWLEQRWLYGFAEWYSNTYYVEDIAPLANLIDFAQDEEIVAKARIILDLLLYDLATQSWRGNFISSSGRMYAKGKRYPEKNSMQAVIDDIWDPARWERQPSERIGMDYNFILIENYTVPPVIKAIGEDDERVVVIKGSNGLDVVELEGEGLLGLEDPQIMMQLAMEAFSNATIIENTMAYADEHNMLGNEFLHDMRLFNLGILRKTGALPAVNRHLNPVTDGVAIQRANTYTYKDPDFMVASAQAYHPGSFGDQQHLWNAVLSQDVSVFTTHPAKPLSDKGALSGSPGYWVGNGRIPHIVQQENVVLSVMQPPAGTGFMEKSIVDYTHAHFPQERFDEVIVDEHYAFGRTGEAYAALVARHPLHYREGTTDDLVQPGLDSYWVFEAGSARRDGEFEAFVRRIRGNAISYNEGRLSYRSGGKALDLDYAGDFTVDGEIQDLQYPRFASPYAMVQRKPDLIRIEHNGSSLKLDFYKQRRTIKQIPRDGDSN